VQLSCCAWALTGPEENNLAVLADLGFGSIDIQARTFTGAEARARIDDLGLDVSCLALSFNMVDGAALDAADAAGRQRAIDHCRAALDHAADLGTNTTYVVPGDDPSLLPHFTQALPQVADFAAERDISVGVEHFPGKALPTAAGTLEWLADLGHPNLYLLLDIGHLQMSQEDPVATIAAAADRLAYVHLDDNDGEGDLHWALLDGVLTAEALATTLAALKSSPYAGPVSLELNPQLPDPLAAINKSRNIVLPHL